MLPFSVILAMRSHVSSIRVCSWYQVNPPDAILTGAHVQLTLTAVPAQSLTSSQLKSVQNSRHLIDKTFHDNPANFEMTEIYAQIQNITLSEAYARLQHSV